MGRVIYLNQLLGVSRDEEYRRDCLQDHINSIHAQINNEAKKTPDPEFNRTLFKKRFHDEMRKMIRKV